MSGSNPTAASTTPRNDEQAHCCLGGPSRNRPKRGGQGNVRRSGRRLTSCAVKRRIAVAVSGGRDSTALWHATARMARASGALEVMALHVHHGLQAQADDWLRHLQRQSRRWAAAGLPVSLDWRRLLGAPAKGESTEAWARRERYAALIAMAQAHRIDVVLLAHHRRDQAETFLLQALRGAGPAGLAAMPRESVRQGIHWVRPWLEQPYGAIEAYVRRYRLGYVEDESNADTRWARNRLRHQIWPALSGGFEHVDTSLAASARRAHEGAVCLQELASLDLEACGQADGWLDVSAWSGLSGARRANLLRAWLAGFATDGVPDSLVQRLLQELPAAEAARWPLGCGELRLHAGRLAYAADSKRPSVADVGETCLDMSRPGRYEVPAWQGAFEVVATKQEGLAPKNLRRCMLRARRGGERFQRTPGSPPRSLKKQYQATGVAAWLRDGPLVFANDELLFVPVLGIDARWRAAPGSRMLGLRWVANDSPATPVLDPLLD